jgi:hypothetical protein
VSGPPARDGAVPDAAPPAFTPPTAVEIAATTLSLLAARPATASICPSEVARALAPSPAWRGLMPAVREAARTLARQGRLEVTQGGRALSPDADWRGAIRLRRTDNGG